jgi:uncharacterized protein YsxB (DUF464 family)
MIVESIQRVFALTPLFTEQEIYKTVRDPKTLKEYTEIITWRVYNQWAQVEESYQPKIDLRA